MSRRRNLRALVAVMALALSGAASPAVGEVARLPPAPPELEARRLAGVAGLAPEPPSADVGASTRRVMVELAVPAAAVAVPGGGDPAVQRSRAAAVDAAADAVLASAPVGVVELGRLRAAVPALLVEAPAAAVDALRRAPGVRRVDAIVDYAPALQDVVPYVGGTEVQQGGADGDGVRVAVIDSGVDYTHEALGGAGTSVAFERAYGLSFDEARAIREGEAPAPATAENTSARDDDGVYFPTPKVVGGYDFVGEAYTGEPDSPAEAPDPNPIDVEGHGTHIADIVAGTIGMAPGAELVALKACASSGGPCSGTAVLRSLEYALDPNSDGAIDDAVDVVNLSLGTPYGVATRDPLARMVQASSARGVLSVASAGNGGDAPYNLVTPAGAPAALAMAQTAVPGPEQGTVAVTSSRGPSNGANLAKPDLGAPGASVSAVAATGTETTAFSGTSGAAPVASGAAALLLDDDPELVPGQVKALLQTTAEHPLTLTDGSDAPVTRVGGGEVRVERAVEAPAVVRGADGDSATLSFGLLDVTGTATRRRTLVIENREDALPVAYDVATTVDDGSGAVQVSADPQEVVVLPGGEAEVGVIVEVRGDRLSRWTLGSGLESADALTRLAYEGAVLLTPQEGTSGPSLRAPLHVLPRAAGDVTADRDELSEGASTEVSLSNGGVTTANVNTYTLVAEGPPPEEGSSGLDLRALGVTTQKTTPETCSSGFALRLAFVAAQRTVHANVPFLLDVLVDVDGDGTPDHEIYNLDFAAGSGRFTGVNATFARDLSTGDTTATFATNHATNSENTELAVCGDHLGLSGDGLGEPLTLSARAFDHYYRGEVTDTLPEVVVRPGAERFKEAGTDVAPGATERLQIDDAGEEGTYGIGALALLDATREDGRSGTIPGRSALVLRAPSADGEEPEEPVDDEQKPPAETAQPRPPPTASPTGSPVSSLPDGRDDEPRDPESSPTASPSPSPSGSSPPPPSPAPSSSSTPPPAPRGVERFAGANRIATSVAISQQAFPEGAPVALLARADDYPDALAGSPLATALGGPLLLNPSDALDELVHDELVRLGVEEVVLLGGAAAQSVDVAEALRGDGFAVRRVAGANRFATAVDIADEVRDLRPSDEVVVVEGADADPARGFPDALSAAGLAASQGLPILLATTESLPDETAEAVAGDDVLVVGGTVAVGADVEEALDARAGGVRRLAGATRYATSVAVAEEASSRGLDLDTLWVATGLAFPDALAAGAAAGAADTVVLLVDGNTLEASEATGTFLRRRRDDLRLVLIAGGPNAVSLNVGDALSSLVAG